MLKVLHLHFDAYKKYTEKLACFKNVNAPYICISFIKRT